MPIDPISLSLAGIGLAGSLFSKSQDQINREYYSKIRRKAKRSARETYNKRKIALDTKAKANKGGLVAINERIQRQQGILGTSAGAENINKGITGLANAYNVQSADLDTQFTKDMNDARSITAPPEKSNEDLYSGLLSYGVGNIVGDLGQAKVDNVDEIEMARRKARRRSRRVGGSI